jgi:hypothetical protein
LAKAQKEETFSYPAAKTILNPPRGKNDFGQKTILAQKRFSVKKSNPGLSGASDMSGLGSTWFVRFLNREITCCRRFE